MAALKNINPSLSRTIYSQVPVISKSVWVTRHLYAYESIISYIVHFRPPQTVAKNFTTRSFTVIYCLKAFPGSFQCVAQNQQTPPPLPQLLGQKKRFGWGGGLSIIPSPPATKWGSSKNNVSNLTHFIILQSQKHVLMWKGPTLNSDNILGAFINNYYYKPSANISKMEACGFQQYLGGVKSSKDNFCWAAPLRRMAVSV